MWPPVQRHDLGVVRYFAEDHNHIAGLDQLNVIVVRERICRRGIAGDTAHETSCLLRPFEHLSSGCGAVARLFQCLWGQGRDSSIGRIDDERRTFVRQESFPSVLAESNVTGCQFAIGAGPPPPLLWVPAVRLWW